jgi:hypothetical protein
MKAQNQQKESVLFLSQSQKSQEPKAGSQLQTAELHIFLSLHLY